MRNYNKLDIELFKSKLEHLTDKWEEPESWSKKEIEIQERKSTELFNKVLDELIPLEPTKITPTWLNWWNDELQILKDKLRKCYRLTKSRFANNFIKHSYKKLYKEY